MITVKFIQDYYVSGKLEILKDKEYEINEVGGTIPIGNRFIDIYDIYDMRKNKIVEIITE